MTLHTIMPLEVVFDGMSDGARAPATLEVRTADMRLQLEPVCPGVGRIVRLLECPLDHYLRPDLAPGSLYVYGNPT